MKFNRKTQLWKMVIIFVRKRRIIMCFREMVHDVHRVDVAVASCDLKTRDE